MNQPKANSLAEYYINDFAARSTHHYISDSGHPASFLQVRPADFESSRIYEQVKAYEREKRNLEAFARFPLSLKK